MAVTPFRIADKYALVKGGRMQYIFEGSGRLATTGTPAVNEIVFSGAVLENSTLDLVWNGYTTTLVAKKAPSAANEFPSGNVSSGYVDVLVGQLATYFPLQEDFVVERGVSVGNFHTILLTAKQPGVAFNLAEASAPGVVAKVATAGADPVVRANYSVYVELWAQTKPGGTYTRIDDAFLEADATNRYSYNAGDVLHDLLMQPDWPSWHFPEPLSGTRSHCQYYVAYSEAYGNPRQPGRMYKTETRHAYLGGVDYRHRAGGGEPLTNLTQTAGAGGTVLCKALRLGPDTRFVRADEPQFLSFINTTGADIPGGDVQLEVVVKMTDDSERIVTDSFARQPFLDGDKVTFPVGIAQLSLLTLVPEGKTLQEYTVQLTAVTDASTVYRFVLDDRYERYVRYFAYLSSLGVVDTLLTYGKGSSELMLSYEQAERYLPANYAVSDGQFVNYDVQLQQQLDVATGYRSAAELRGFIDFYRAPIRYHLQAGPGGTAEALPIGLVSKSVKQQTDGDTLFAHQFTYQYLFRDDFYSLSAEDALSEMPPLGFTPAGGGSVIIAQPVLVPSIDLTVPNAVRALTADKIESFEQTVVLARQTADKKYLDQALGNELYRRGDLKIDFINDVGNRPTTRDGYQISDVPTFADAIQQTLDLLPLRARLTSWTDEVEPS